VQSKSASLPGNSGLLTLAGSALGWAAAVLLGVVLSPIAAAAGRCDVALVLALDLSSSTADRHGLVTRGTAASLRHYAVADAFSGQAVKVRVFAWADIQVPLVGWTEVSQRADLLALADRLEEPLHARTGSGTNLTFAVNYARSQLAEVDCDREVVDILTDGDAVSPVYSVRRFDRDFQVINVLWVGSDPAHRQMVETDLRFGHGAFVLQIADYRELERAMVRKLVMEVAAAGAP
jgi:hypothetical protein